MQKPDCDCVCDFDWKTSKVHGCDSATKRLVDEVDSEGFAVLVQPGGKSDVIVVESPEDDGYLVFRLRTTKALLLPRELTPGT